MLHYISGNISRRAFLKMLGFGGLAVILDACDAINPTPTVPPPTTALTSTPNAPANLTARAFLTAWSKGDFAAMYQLLAPAAHAQLTQDEFVKFYETTTAEATITAVRPALGTTVEEGKTATAPFKSHFETAALGVIEEDNALALSRASGVWGIVWSRANFLQALGANNSLKLYPVKSTRGNIYDRNGMPLAIGQKAIVVSVWPAEMRRNQAEAKVLAALAAIVNLSQFDIQRKYANLNPEWKTVIATISPDLAQANADALSLPGVVTEEQDARAYPQGTAAAHIAGYVGQISADELSEVYGKGYREGDFLGRAGLERAGEKYLSGGRGGTLAVISPTGDRVATITERAAQQSQSIYSTIDLDLQKAVDTILGNRRGSLTVMDIKTGNILAMVSHPTYDPNAFMDSTRQSERANILTSPQHLLLNRATQGAYPQGSVEKIVTIATAIERGGMGQYTPFHCSGVWNGIGYPKSCWITAYGKTHGDITLQHALTASCDVTFYQVGFALNKRDQNLMPSFAYAFGLGSNTGIEIEESDGNVPDPKKQQPWIPTDPVDMAIGQDTFLVSPLQILDFVVAVANGGILWRPRLIGKIQDLAIGTEQVLQPEKRGDLPASPNTLQIIRDALKGVTTNKDGTAKFVFDGLPVICAGKTGTAQVPGKNDPHAWFAGYAPADNPEIACVAMVENGGEGSKVAAPLFRKVIEKYFHVEPTPTPAVKSKTPTAPATTPTPVVGE
jgi:penicillin-binding protein 2